MERTWTIAWSGTIIMCQVPYSFWLSNTPSGLFNSILTILFLSSIKNWQPFCVNQQCWQIHSYSSISGHLRPFFTISTASLNMCIDVNQGKRVESWYKFLRSLQIPSCQSFTNDGSHWITQEYLFWQCPHDIDKHRVSIF